MATTESPIVPIEPEVDPPAALEGTAADEAPPQKTTKTKRVSAVKDPKAKKVPAPRKRNPTHPPYFGMIEDAIVTLQDKTGSSQYAITKFIEDKQKNLPPNFKKLLLVQLKKFVANGKLVKVKSSYKMPSSRAPKPAAASAPEKKPASVKPKAKAAATMGKTAVVSKAKPKAKTAAVKSKGATPSIAKPAAKAKTAAAKPKAAALTKKAATKRKAPEKAKAEKKSATKVAKTSTRSTPRRSSTVAAVTRKASAVKKAAPIKRAPSKSVKPKSIKSPAKKAVGKRGKK